MNILTIIALSIGMVIAIRFLEDTEWQEASWVYLSGVILSMMIWAFFKVIAYLSIIQG